MNKVIWKFPLEVKDYVVVSMPRGSQVLHVDTQNGIPTIWALYDPEAERRDRTFWIKTTGAVISDLTNYHGTFQLVGGSFIGHVFS